MQKMLYLLFRKYYSQNEMKNGELKTRDQNNLEVEEIAIFCVFAFCILSSIAINAF